MSWSIAIISHRELSIVVLNREMRASFCLFFCMLCLQWNGFYPRTFWASQSWQHSFHSCVYAYKCCPSIISWALSCSRNRIMKAQWVFFITAARALHSLRSRLFSFISQFFFPWPQVDNITYW